MVFGQRSFKKFTRDTSPGVPDFMRARMKVYGELNLEQVHISMIKGFITVKAIGESFKMIETDSYEFISPRVRYVGYYALCISSRSLAMCFWTNHRFADV